MSAADPTPRHMHHHSAGGHAAGRPAMSLLRLSGAARLLGAAVLLALLWTALMWVTGHA